MTRKTIIDNSVDRGSFFASSETRDHPPVVQFITGTLNGTFVTTYKIDSHSPDYVSENGHTYGSVSVYLVNKANILYFHKSINSHVSKTEAKVVIVGVNEEVTEGLERLLLDAAKKHISEDYKLAESMMDYDRSPGAPC